MSPNPRRARLRVTVATSTALAVAATTVLAVGGAASAVPVTAPSAADDRPAAAGAAWLAGRLQGGLLPGDFGPLYGQSIDAALALDAVGGRSADVSAIGTALEEAAGSYVEYSFDSGGTTYYGEVAGATGKALVLANLVGANPGSFGGIDLVERAQSLLVADGPATGRIFDTAQDAPDYQYANSLGQAFVVRGLHEVGSLRAPQALDYLLSQQCPDGHFRQTFPDIGAANQGCATPAAAGTGPDTTAIVVLQLQGLAGTNPVVDAALTDATEWLVGRQATDGAFTAGTATEGENTNSTGLAGWALGVRGAGAPAARAAAWVRARQVQPVSPCTTALDAEPGAVAFDDRALATGRTGDLDDAFQQWNITATQAVPALLWARKGATVRVAAKEWGRASTNHRVAVRGLAPGETVCVRSKVSRTLDAAGVGGGVRSAVKLPRRAGNRDIVVADSTQAYRTTVRAVVPKELGVRVAKRPLPAGTVQRIVVRGLVGGEPAQVFVRGRRVARGEAGPRGRFVARVRLSKAGPARVRATGVLPKVRVGRAAFRVVR
ncbi:MAG: hypothetical protein Q8Q02_15405 [Nocardioides sp.]|nr:hypothetical protein [Nocardioides sp.]